MDLGLGGRGYLVTGASRGPGFAAARALVADGARVLANARAADTAGRQVAAARDRLGRVAASLLSPAASSVTGTTLAVDGGRLRTP